MTVYPDYPFQSHFYSIGDNRLHYVDEGGGDVIVMVHGNPAWSYAYRKLIKKMFRVEIAPHVHQHYIEPLKPPKDRKGYWVFSKQIRRIGPLDRSASGKIDRIIFFRHLIQRRFYVVLFLKNRTGGKQ